LYSYLGLTDVQFLFELMHILTENAQLLYSVCLVR